MPIESIAFPFEKQYKRKHLYLKRCTPGTHVSMFGQRQLAHVAKMQWLHGCAIAQALAHVPYNNNFEICIFKHDNEKVMAHIYIYCRLAIGLLSACAYKSHRYGSMRLYKSVRSGVRL